jgi:hypothetical protein
VIPGAHNAYFKGRYFFDRPSDENLTKAISQFDEAVNLEPNFAPAYSGLSDAYLWAALYRVHNSPPRARYENSSVYHRRSHPASGRCILEGGSVGVRDAR